MSLIIENIDTVNVTIDDLGIFLAPSQQYDLTQDEPNAIAMSSDLPSAISGGQITVYDPLDDVTPLSTSDALEAIAATNDTHFRIRGGELNQLNDVDTSGVSSGDYLYYNGSNFVIRDPADVAVDLFGSPQPFVHLTGDEDIAGEKRFVDEIRVGGSAISDLQITFNGPDGPAAGYAIRQVGTGSPQIFPGTLFFMDTAAFPQVLMGSNEAETVAGYIDVDNDGVLNLNVLHTGAVVIGPGGLLPSVANTSIGNAGAPWGLIHLDDEIRFHETAAGSPIHYVSFEAPASISSSVTWTLPATDSTGTQALVSDGAGTLSWSSINVPQNLWETFTSDSGSTSANTTTDTLTISGGTGISTSIAADTLTITNDSPNVDQNLWETINADTGSTTANTTTDTLTISGGTGISTSIVGDTLTITNTSSATPGGDNHDVQFNDSGAFGGSSNFEYDDTLQKVSIMGIPETTALEVGSTGGSPDPSGNATLYIEVNTPSAEIEGQRVYFNRQTPGSNGWILYHYDDNTPNIRLIDEDDDPPYISFRTIGSGTFDAPEFESSFGARGSTSNRTTGFSWYIGNVTNGGTEIMSLDTDFLNLNSGQYQMNSTPIPLKKFHFFADQFDYPRGSNWSINNGAPATVDTVNSALKVRRFDDTTIEAVGFMVSVPQLAREMIVRTKARAQSTPGGTVAAIIQLRKRSIGDNVSISSWSTNSLTTISLPTNTNFQYDETSDTLTNWGISAGVTYQMQLVRNATSGSDTLSGDLCLLELEIEFR